MPVLDRTTSLGILLKQKREDMLGSPNEVSQEDIADVVGVVQPYISKLERGRLDKTIADKWKSERVLSLLKAYKLSDSEIFELAGRFGLDIPDYLLSHTDTLQRTQRFEVADTFIRFPVYQSVSAGELDADPIEGEVATIPLEDLKRAGADSRNVRVYLVNGDCMVAQSERGLVMSIVHGDKIGVDTSQRSGQRNEIVAAYWRPQDKLVIKRLIEDDNGGILLVPASPGHPKLVAESDDDFDIIGKVIWRGGPVGGH